MAITMICKECGWYVDLEHMNKENEMCLLCSHEETESIFEKIQRIIYQNRHGLISEEDAIAEIQLVILRNIKKQEKISINTMKGGE